MRARLHELLQSYATTLENLADKNYESFEELGTGDYAAQLQQFRLDAKEAFKVFRHTMIELIAELVTTDPILSHSLRQFVMNFPGPFTGAHYADDSATDYIVQPGSTVGALDRVGGQQPDQHGRQPRRGVYRKLPGPGQD
jgi:hypothetical protein